MNAETKRRCFVISPIGGEGTEFRQHADMVLNSIIRPALPELDVIRADEFATPDMINDKVIDAIFTYELAVADLSFRNPNVFYEIGLRHMAELPVIHIAQKGTDLPFDTGGMKTIPFDVADWHSHVQVRAAIATAAVRVLDVGYKVSNPVTQARGSINLAKSADTNERLMSQMLQTISKLEVEQSVLKAVVKGMTKISGRAFVQKSGFSGGFSGVGRKSLLDPSSRARDEIVDAGLEALMAADVDNDSNPMS